MDSVFSVAQSLNNQKWMLRPADDRQVEIIAQRFGLSDFIARLLVQKNIAPENIQSFLNPTLKNAFPDPFTLAGMSEFAEYFSDAIMQKKPIGILADFDVDGATSAAIFTRFLKHFGQEPPVYIPDRLKEGYGPSEKAVQVLKEQGAEIIVMLDCGITSFEPIEAAKNLGLDVIVFDHHEPEGELPPANHIINPKRGDDESGLEILAACGVTFLACVAINNKLREKRFFTSDQEEPPLKSWLDLVALGTVCDMVPLTGCNRLFVKTGFQMMAAHNNPGIKALCEVANIETLPKPKDAGWSFGPRINAGSRVYRSDIGAKLLATDCEEEALSLAWALEDCNKERQKIQSEMMRTALNKIEFSNNHHNRAFLVVEDQSFHPGLSGLVAGRLKDKYGKPAVVITYAENEDGVLEGRGSGRSVKGVNMAELFIAARQEGLLEKGGGHAMAGGFTIMPDNIESFEVFAEEFVHAMPQQPMTPELPIHAMASVKGARLDMVKLIAENMGPFGMGNEEPVFLLSDVMIRQVDVLKEQHIRLQLSDNDGGGRMKAMLFGGVGTALGDALLKSYNNTLFHLAGRFQINAWQGRESVEFHVLDGDFAKGYKCEPKVGLRL